MFRIPVTLLTGFLGSGKTTALNHLVQRPELARTLVIINEFGEVGLDHLLMSRVPDDTVVEMSSGCLCCTIRGDLVSTLKDAQWRFSRGGERQFDRVVIETTGLADPAPIVQTLMTVDVITRRYRFDGLVTTIDLINGERTLDTQPEALKQAAMADCLLLTKSDLAEPAAVTSLEQRLLAINPSARRQRVHNGMVAPDALLGLGLFDPTTKIPDVARWLNEEAFLGASDAHASPDADRHHPGMTPGHDHGLKKVSERAVDGHAAQNHHGVDGHDDRHGHGRGHPHNHDPNRHDGGICAFCVVLEQPLEDGLIDAWLDLQLSLCGKDMLRIKGILNIHGRAGPVVIHGVQHVQHPPVEVPAWPSDDHRSRLVFITRDIARETIEKSLGAFIDVWRQRDASLSGAGNDGRRERTA
jgi:G3E family GTPase